MAQDFTWNSAWTAPSQVVGPPAGAYGGWYGNAAIPDPIPEQKEAVITKAAEGFDVQTCEFDDVWASLSEDKKYDILNIIGSDGTKTGDSDGHIKWAGTYDNENIYLFIRAEKSYTPTEADKIEVMVSPYCALSGTPDIKDAYVRYIEFGAWKAGCTYQSDFTNTSDICTGQASSASIYQSPLPVSPSSKTENDLANNVTKWIVVIPHYAIVGDNYEGYLNPDDGLFSEDIFNALCDGKGLCFDVKYVENDGTNETAIWWNATHNNGYQCNAYSGFIAAKDYTSIEESAVSEEVANMTITANQITLNNPVDVKILNASGMLIKSVNDADYVSISELPTGVYIVVAGDESDTFIVK